MRELINRGHHGIVYRNSEGGKTTIDKFARSRLKKDVDDWKKILNFLKYHELKVPEVLGSDKEKIRLQDLGNLTEFDASLNRVSNKAELLLQAAKEAAKMHSLGCSLSESIRAWLIRVDEKGKGELFIVDVGGFGMRKGSMGWDDTLFCLCAFSENERQFKEVIRVYLENAPGNKANADKLLQNGFHAVRELYERILIHANQG